MKLGCFIQFVLGNMNDLHRQNIMRKLQGTMMKTLVIDWKNQNENDFKIYYIQSTPVPIWQLIMNDLSITKF